MNKPRHRMTPEEAKEHEYWRKLKSEKVPEFKFQMMMKRANGQCEAEPNGQRCPNRHLEHGVTVKGRVILTPRDGMKPFLHCQKCGFEEVKERMEKPLSGRGRGKKISQFQVGMFA